MKKLFEEPRMELEAFAISNRIMFLSDIELGENETDPVTGIGAYGGTKSIG